jgi:hypothetical protein
VTWVREKRAVWEMREFDGKPVQHVIGWMDTRHCGCYCVEGMRLDKNEITFGARACDDHDSEVTSAMQKFKTMPGQAVELHELWEEILDHEIGAQ